MKYVRHQPGYTPEAAAARRAVTAMARKLGVPPRKLRRKVRKVLFSSLRSWLEKTMLRELGPLAASGAFAAGGVITRPLVIDPIIDRDYVIPKDRYLNLVPLIQPLRERTAEEDETATVQMKRITEIKINAADLPADDDPRMVKIREMVARHMDATLLRASVQPVTVPLPVNYKLGDLS